MKTILYVDLITNSGHRKFNQLNVEALRKEFEIFTIAHEKAMNETPDLKIPDYLFEFRNRFDYRVRQIRKIDWVMEKAMSFGEFDLVLFSSYETISFSIKSHQVAKLFKNVAIFDHNNIDEMTESIVKRLFFKAIDVNITHLVFEEYFRTYLIDNIKIKNNVVVLPHLVDDIKQALDIVKDVITIFVPSNKYDAGYIKKIISSSPRNFFFIIKADTDFGKDNVRIVKFFENDEYENTFANCNFVLLPLATEYNYRISNTIFECFSYSKPCFTFKDKLSEFLNRSYPNVVHIIDRSTTLNEIIEKYERIDKDAFFTERRKFLDSHSENAFLNGIKSLLR